MTALAINITNIRRAMTKDEQYSNTAADGTYAITFGAFGRQLTVLATPVNVVTAEQIEDGDYPVRYTALIEGWEVTEDYDTMFDAIAMIFLSYYH